MEASTLTTPSSSSSSSPSALPLAPSSSTNSLPSVASVTTSQTVSNGNASLNESATSLQTSFESLSLRTPLQPPTGQDQLQQATAPLVPSIQNNYDYKGHEEAADVQGIEPTIADADGNDESSEGTRGLC